MHTDVTMIPQQIRTDSRRLALLDPARQSGGKKAGDCYYERKTRYEYP